MTTEHIYLFAAAALFGVGVYGMLVADHLLRKILSLNVLGMAVFLLLITLGRRGGTLLDPVPQALVLTGIVIAVSATAFAVALLLALYRRSGHADLEVDDADEGNGA
jgi:multicomponent Na+:H+ antiporter subunit C